MGKEELILTFGDLAIAQLQKELKNSQSGGYIRVGVKGGGCSGLSYVLQIDEKSESDVLYEFGGIQFLIDKRHIMYLNGMHIEYQDGLNSRGFEFLNPNAKTTCGCGTSFSV